jgi:GLPGLI family protein
MLEKIYEKKEFTYTLLFNQNESLFFKNESKFDENEKSLLAIFSPRGKFYYNKKENVILHEKESSNKPFLISMKPINWELTDETKIINGYKCYKAIGKRKYKSRKGYLDRETIVWFTKEIPYNFAPASFVGLPGFAIFIKSESIEFELTKIDTNLISEIKINKLSKGEKITYEDFQEESERLAKQKLELFIQQH